MAMKRQLPKLSELRELMQFKKPELDPVKRQLDKALTVYDLRDIAKRRTPKGPFDYTDGAAEFEISLARARQAFEDIEFRPDILRPATEIDTSVEILGGLEPGERIVYSSYTAFRTHPVIELVPEGGRLVE